MRKIEKAVWALINAHKEGTIDNTSVEWAGEVATIRLHGNAIAIYRGAGVVEVNAETARRWPTRTTVSRLRALGVPARLQKGKIYIRDTQV